MVSDNDRNQDEQMNLLPASDESQVTQAVLAQNLDYSVLNSGCSVLNSDCTELNSDYKSISTKNAWKNDDHNYVCRDCGREVKPYKSGNITRSFNINHRDCSSFGLITNEEMNQLN